MSQVQDIINAVSQDLRLQLSATAAPGQPILIDYCNRTHKEMLRFSRWGFLLSEPQHFITVKGQTDYWIGPNANFPGGMVNTGLNLIDVDKIQKDSVRDLSNSRSILPVRQAPSGPNQTNRLGQSRPFQPGQYWQDWELDPNILHLYPAADNANTLQPVPSSPYVSTTAGGSLAAQDTYTRITFVDSLGGESTGSSVSVQWNVPANHLLVVESPTILYNVSSNGAVYGFYNVYVGTSGEGSETLQNNSPIAIGTNWTEPASGITTSGQAVPIENTLQQFGGYLIEFRYYRDRLVLTQVEQVTQIPDDYFDVFVQGVLALALKFLGKNEEAQASYQLYQKGLTGMIWDKNLRPGGQFIRPDTGTYVNQQILGYLPPFF